MAKTLAWQSIRELDNKDNTVHWSRVAFNEFNSQQSSESADFHVSFDASFGKRRPIKKKE